MDIGYLNTKKPMSLDCLTMIKKKILKVDKILKIVLFDRVRSIHKNKNPS